jgi:hypothetical protein
MGISKILKRPALGYGVGLGNSELFYVVKNDTSTQTSPSTDNYYLTLILDSGIPASGLFVVTLGCFCWLGIKIYFIRDGEAELLAGMLGLSVLGIAVVKSVLSIDYNLLFMYLSFAMLIVLKEQVIQQKEMRVIDV